MELGAIFEGWVNAYFELCVLWQWPRKHTPVEIDRTSKLRFNIRIRGRVRKLGNVFNYSCSSQACNCFMSMSVEH